MLCVNGFLHNRGEFFSNIKTYDGVKGNDKQSFKYYLYGYPEAEEMSSKHRIATQFKIKVHCKEKQTKIGAKYGTESINGNEWSIKKRIQWIKEILEKLKNHTKFGEMWSFFLIFALNYLKNW